MGEGGEGDAAISSHPSSANGKERTRVVRGRLEIVRPPYFTAETFGWSGKDARRIDCKYAFNGLVGRCSLFSSPTETPLGGLLVAWVFFGNVPGRLSLLSRAINATCVPQQKRSSVEDTPAVFLGGKEEATLSVTLIHPFSSRILQAMDIFICPVSISLVQYKYVKLSGTRYVEHVTRVPQKTQLPALAYVAVGRD